MTGHFWNRWFSTWSKKSNQKVLFPGNGNFENSNRNMNQSGDYYQANIIKRTLLSEHYWANFFHRTLWKFENIFLFISILFFGFKTIFNLNLSDQMPDNPHLRLFWSNSCSHKSFSLVEVSQQGPSWSDRPANPLVKINWFGFGPNRSDGIIEARADDKVHGH